MREGEANLGLAIQAYQEALRVYTFQAFPQNYAGIQNNLGNAYGDLAKVRDKEANLNLAIGAFRQALRVFIFATLPQDCAMTHSNLGRAYRDLVLARLEGGAAEEAKDLWRAARNSCVEALRVYTQEAYPERHAALTKHLNALDALLAETP